MLLRAEAGWKLSVQGEVKKHTSQVILLPTRSALPVPTHLVASRHFVELVVDVNGPLGFADATDL
jgi:hypothetical protein